MRHIMIFWLTVVYILSSIPESTTFNNIGLLPLNTEESLKKMVGQLSGKHAIVEGYSIHNRWGEKEKKATRVYLKHIINSLGLSPIENNYKQRNRNPAVDLILNPYEGINIYGVLPSTTPSDEYIILGAHYDTGKHDAPGAIDNATGMALIYHVTKEMFRLTYRSKNIILVFFDQEEEENIGSKAFIQLINKKKWNIHSVHCVDMIGWDNDNNLDIEVFSASESLMDIYDNSAAQYSSRILKKVLTQGTPGSTDLYAFLNNGYNAIGIGECYYHGDSSPFKDSSLDTYDTVDFDYLFHATKVVEKSISTLLIK